MTRFKDSDLYGKLPLKAVKDFMSNIPKDVRGTGVWAYFGAFLVRYYGTNLDKLDNKIVEKLLDSYEKQGHSGGSHGVVTQAIMAYLAGEFDDEDKAFVRGEDRKVT